MRSERYALIQKALHWLIAIVVIGMIASGLYMTSIGFGSDVSEADAQIRNALYEAHKSFGFVVLGLMGLRVLCRLVFGAPRMPRSMPAVQRLAAGGAHLALYALLFAAPLLGWAAASAGGFLQPMYFEAPPLIDRDPELSRTLFGAHEIVSLVIIGVVAAHVAGALNHLLIRRDGVFRRMWF